MTTKWTITFDCADVETMRGFWRLALGYVDPTPPEGWTSWEDWLRDQQVPEDEWGEGGGLDDPEGNLPDISFLKVPEGKTAKNRVHIDLQVSGGRHVDQPIRVAQIEAMAATLAQAGGRVLARSYHADRLDHLVMADPEGNEFCIV